MRARVRVFVCICVCACVGACLRVCSCVFVSVSVYIGGGVGAEVCVFILAKPGDCDVSIPVVVGNSILNQLILVMMLLE